MLEDLIPSPEDVKTHMELQRIAAQIGNAASILFNSITVVCLSSRAKKILIDKGYKIRKVSNSVSSHIISWNLNQCR